MKKQTERGTLFLERIPKDTKAAFKAACAKRQVTMQSALIELMRRFTKEAGMR